MPTQREKIRSLFYSTDPENRALAFELAKGLGCREEVINEFYKALQELPSFEQDRSYWLEIFREDCEEDNIAFPTDALDLKQAHIHSFCNVHFHPSMNLKGSVGINKEQSKLTTFPKVLLNCQFITKLNLSWNNIKEIPKEIVQLHNLVRLDLSCNNELRNLPDELGQLPALKELILYGIPGIFSTPQRQVSGQDTYAYDFPSCIRQMKQLEHLDLGDVIVTEIPEWLHELRQLKYLTLFSGMGSNPYLKIPKTFTQLSNLELLQINAYSVDIPEDIDKMQSLECLVIEPAVSIPNTIKNLKKLTYLDLSYLSYDAKFTTVEGYESLFDIDDKGIPDGVSRIQIYGWEWLKEMTWLKEFTFKHIKPYAFTNIERQELETALPDCTFIFEA
ncbi:leucine-rich repeat domain-containing protein [Aureispira sp. CCB-QB1]|uniref:leucine-rich repeat domain-containing protein n=1 Tax=Aureispira sp. CCB-QB1 TaxID=1313421 RepID=UPI0006960599|nr:hypothetical protein [Aureispira sp. CCB-QB1]